MWTYRKRESSIVGLAPGANTRTFYGRKSSRLTSLKTRAIFAGKVKAYQSPLWDYLLKVEVFSSWLEVNKWPTLKIYYNYKIVVWNKLLYVKTMTE